MLYDYDVNEGGDGVRTQLGEGGDVVKKLISALKKKANYKIYADNIFTSVSLLGKLTADGILYTGTARKNRVPNFNMASEKELQKQRRGLFDYRVEDQHNIAAVWWYDNRAIILLFIQTCIDPHQTMNKWDRKRKQQVHVPMHL